MNANAVLTPEVVSPNGSGSRIAVCQVPASILTEGDHSDLQRCEAVIAKGWETFVEVGRALSTIRDRRLYRAEFKTFEDYCRRKWQFTRSYASYLIGAIEVMENLSTIVDISLPARESQVRPLVGLPPEAARSVWLEAVQEAGEKPVTAAVVRRKVRELVQPSPAPRIGNCRKPRQPDVDHLQRALECLSLIEKDLDELPNGRAAILLLRQAKGHLIRVRHLPRASPSL